jgi:hypothetical protein
MGAAKAPESGAVEEVGLHTGTVDWDQEIAVVCSYNMPHGPVIKTPVMYRLRTRDTVLGSKSNALTFGNKFATPCWCALCIRPGSHSPECPLKVLTTVRVEVWKRKQQP